MKISAACFSAALLLSSSVSGPSSAQANARAAAAATRCELSAVAPLPVGTPVYDAALGGSVVARFTGRPVPVTVSDLGAARVSLRTGDGSDGVRITGYLEQRALAVETRVPIAVIPGHVWINASERVEIAAADATNVRVIARLAEPVQGEFVAWTGCETIGLAPVGVLRQTLWQPATPYASQSTNLALFDEPTSTARRLITLVTTPKFVLWGIQQQGQFVRVRHRSAIIIDAWVRSGDVTRLAEDEVYAALPKPSPAPVARLLELTVPGDAPRIVTTSEVALRTAQAGPVIGAIEPRTALLVLGTSDGWTKVLPERLELAPAEGAGFWVAAADLGL